MPTPRCTTADAVRILKSGGVLLLATDTLPGLHCRADDQGAVQRILACKGRAAEKSLLVVAGSSEQAWTVVAPLAADQIAACERCWPGPFSLILPAGPAVAPAVTAGGRTLAVRVPAVEALRQIILAVGVPLVSTSANRSGAVPARDLAGAAAEFGTEVDGVWGEEPQAGAEAIPSAVVDLTTQPFAVLRPGPQAFPVA